MVIQLSQDIPKPPNYLFMHDHLLCISLFFCTPCLSPFDNDKQGETLNYLVFVIGVLFYDDLNDMDIDVLFYDGLNDVVEHLS